MKATNITDNRGMALVLVLMVVAIITAMVVEFAYGVYINTQSLTNWQTSQKLSLAARSAIKLGGRLISENQSRYSYTYPGTLAMVQPIPFEDLEGTISLRIEDETAKFNLNSLVYVNHNLNETAYKSFTRLLKALRLKAEIADRVTDWIDPDSEPRLRDSESAAKNSYLDSIDELLNMPGIDQETYERLLPCVTIYGSGHGYGTGLININSADVPVLMSLSDEIDEKMAERIISFRETAPFEKIQDILKVAGFETSGTSLLSYITVKGGSFHVTASALSGDIRRVIESVMEVSGSGRTVRYWKEI
ncbi:MAG: type II secretion system minor pseudopilin GspK [Nitrospirae bacterium]|nr:type II secretion system minor pseudopilin GspK [Nitrospirota bacterium]